MIALIDGDILIYEFASLKNEDGDTIAPELAIFQMEERVGDIIKAVEATEHQLYLTGKGNFRVDLATIKTYKGTRKKEKPPHYDLLRFHMEKNMGATVITGMEADDAMAIAQTANRVRPPRSDTPHTVICSRDKDLNMVAGYHYGWKAGNCKEVPMWLQTCTGGLRCFYKQLLTGDSVDNIPGLFGVGGKSVLVKRIDSCDTEHEMHSAVFDCYRDRFGSYAPAFMKENAQLLYMKLTEEDVWDHPEEIIIQLKEQGNWVFDLG